MLTKVIRSYLASKKSEPVILEEIAAYLKKDREVVLHALNFLIQKGLVKEEVSEISCEGCSCIFPCKPANKKFYRLI